MSQSDGLWHPDPSGRHQYRWWDGAAWTERVADWSGSGIDPYTGPQVPPDSSLPTAPPLPTRSLPTAPPLGDEYATDVLVKDRVPTGPTDAIKICFSKYAKFRGRAAPSEFWWFVLFSVLGSFTATIVLAVALAADLAVFELLFILWHLAMVLPLLAVTVRRLHDIGRSGWWLLLSFIPFVGFIVIILLVIPTRRTDNAYGSPPRLIIQRNR